jgi:Domain of unknown function (DUF4198)
MNKTGSKIMKRIFFILILVIGLGLSMNLWGHSHWLLTDNFYPGNPGKLTISVCSGHRFPTSNFALKDNVFHEAAIYGPMGKQLISAPLQGKKRIGTVQLKEPGIHLLSFSLQRQRDKAPRFQGKTIIHVGKVTENKKPEVLYQLGTGLEIVPLTLLPNIKKGDTLDLKLLLDGNAISGSCSIVPAGKKSFNVVAGKDGKLSIPLKHEGAYLVTCYLKGKGCSLSIQVKSTVKD